MRADGASSRLLNLRGQWRDKIGDKDGARDSYERAGRAGQDSAPRFNLALLHCHAQRNDEAMACLDQAIQLEPEARGYRVLRGNLLERLGRMDAARGARRDAIVQNANRVMTDCQKNRSSLPWKLSSGASQDDQRCRVDDQGGLVDAGLRRQAATGPKPTIMHGCRFRRGSGRLQAGSYDNRLIYGVFRRSAPARDGWWRWPQWADGCRPLRRARRLRPSGRTSGGIRAHRPSWRASVIRLSGACDPFRWHP